MFRFIFKLIAFGFRLALLPFKFFIWYWTFVFNCVKYCLGLLLRLVPERVTLYKVDNKPQASQVSPEKAILTDIRKHQANLIHNSTECEPLITVSSPTTTDRIIKTRRESMDAEMEKRIDDQLERVKALTQRYLKLYQRKTVEELFLKMLQSTWESSLQSTTPDEAIMTMTFKSRRLSKEETESSVPVGVHAVYNHLKDLKAHITMAKFYHVPNSYYSWELDERCDELLAPSIDHLCKTIVFENTKYRNGLGPRYICALVQYVDKLNTMDMDKYIKTKYDIPGKAVTYRLAPEEVSKELTGFDKGAVCPFGLKTELPVLVSKSITRLNPPVMFLGSGHIDWKICVSVKEFLTCSINPHMVDM